MASSKEASRCKMLAFAGATAICLGKKLDAAEAPLNIAESDVE